MAPLAFREQLQASIDETLRVEARRIELTIARVRVIALALVASLDFMLYLQPGPFKLAHPFPLANAVLAAAWLAFAAGLFLMLKRGSYHAAVRPLLPAVDGLVLLTLFTCILLTVEDASQVAQALVNIGISCALLAVTGGLRLHRTAVLVTTAVAVATFALISAMAGTRLPDIIFSCALLGAIGLMGNWLNAITRRSVASEVGRLVLGRFLPEEVVRGAHEDAFAMLTSPRRLEATVLVTDLRGFTALSEQLAPEEVLERLNRIQSTLAEAVHDAGGRVDKFMGDGMLAVFGMDGAGDGHAVAALRAALAMPAALEAAGAGAGQQVRVGIGVHTGPVVAGCLGSGMRLEFTVLGDTVNTAARLQDMTKELGDLVVSGATRAAVLEADLPQWQWTSLGDRAIRGRQATLPLFSVVESRP